MAKKNLRKRTFSHIKAFLKSINDPALDRPLVQAMKLAASSVRLAEPRVNEYYF
jgi:hypothetical protein